MLAEPMQTNLRSLPEVQIRVIQQTSSPISEPKRLEFSGSLPAALTVAPVLFVNEVDRRPDTVGAHISMRVIEVAEYRLQQLRMLHDHLSLAG